MLNITETTGLDVVFANPTHRNVSSMLEGTALALVLISLLMAVALRSFRLGVISMVPNVFPALMAYGLWGILVGHVDTATSVVACLSLGIVVDDTVHFLSKYNYARDSGSECRGCDSLCLPDSRRRLTNHVQFWSVVSPLWSFHTSCWPGGLYRH